MPNPYLTNTSRTAERRLQAANVRAMQSSGLPGYQRHDRERQRLLRDIENKRPLRRSEFIHLYGYQAWLDYCDKYGLSPEHKWADAHQHRLSSIGNNL